MNCVLFCIANPYQMNCDTGLSESIGTGSYARRSVSGLIRCSGGVNAQNAHGLLGFERCSRTGNRNRFLAAAALLTGISEIRQWSGLSKRTNIESKDWAICGAGQNRDMKRRLTMLRDKTTRSKFAARQPNGRERDRLSRSMAAIGN